MRWLESSSQPGRVPCQPSCSYLANLLECCDSPTSSKRMVQISGNIPHQKLTQPPSLSRLMPMVRLPNVPTTWRFRKLLPRSQCRRLKSNNNQQVSTQQQVVAWERDARWSLACLL